MLEKLLGGPAPERVLLYLCVYEEGYAQGIAKTFGMPLSVIQKQLKRYESAGILASQQKGKTRIFVWNPRYPFRKELRALLEKALDYVPETEIRQFYRERRRPRRAGKPL